MRPGATLALFTCAWVLQASCGHSTLLDPGVGGSAGQGSGGSGAMTGSTTSTTSTGSTSSTTTTSAPWCNDGICQPGETPENCPEDCGSPSCAHSLCQVGEALSYGCESCVATVCDADPYCCDGGWDNQCITAADEQCQTGCCGNGQCEGQSCAFCPGDCGECVCGDEICDGEDCATCADDCGVCPSCPHTVCASDGALSAEACRDPCVAQVCQQQPSCCSSDDNPAWNVPCQELAITLCDADPCVVAVCSATSSCCSTSWTSSCVAQAEQLCNTGCDCAHGPCDSGDPLTPTCDPCAAAVCASDPYCCSASWDGICIGEVGSICGVTCP